VAEFEELKISVKADPEKAAENTKQLQDFFRQAGSIEHIERFEKLGRQFKLSDVQIKQLAESVAKPTNALGGFMTGFGKAGLVLLGVEAAIKIANAAAGVFNSTAQRQIEIQNLADRMGGTHAAQVDADVHAMERGTIERGRAMAMLETFNQKHSDFLNKTTGFRRSLLADVEAPLVSVYEKHFAELEKAPDLSSWKNQVRKFGDVLEERFKDHPEWFGGSKELAAQRGAAEKRKYLERWFGLPEIEQLKEDFVEVSQDAKDAWDKSQRAITDYWKTTTDIKDHIDKIIGGVLAIVWDDLGVGWAMRKLDFGLGRGVAEGATALIMTDAEREAYIKQEAAKRDEAWAATGYLHMPAYLQRLYETGETAASFHERWLLEHPGEREKKQSELLDQEKRLTDNLASVNDALRGDGQGPAFHNRPRGGVYGESDPERMPRNHPQPGGGAAAESRQPLEGRTFEAKESTIYYTAPKGSKAATYTDPATGQTYTDKTKPIDLPTSGLPSETPGIAFGYRNFPRHGRETLGGYYQVTPNAGPNAGQSFILPHSDIGPGAGRGERIDYNAPAAMQVFGSMKESDIRGGADLKYIGRTLPEGVSVGPQIAGAGNQQVADAGGLSRDRIDRLNELDVRGRLNVKVEAPTGTTVRASGGGMFKDGVTLDRSLGM
jgi:hypothetical protein